MRIIKIEINCALGMKGNEINRTNFIDLKIIVIKNLALELSKQLGGAATTKRFVNS